MNSDIQKNKFNVLICTTIFLFSLFLFTTIAYAERGITITSDVASMDDATISNGVDDDCDGTVGCPNTDAIEKIEISVEKVQVEKTSSSVTKITPTTDVVELKNKDEGGTSNDSTLRGEFVVTPSRIEAVGVNPDDNGADDDCDGVRCLEAKYIDDDSDGDGLGVNDEIKALPTRINQSKEIIVVGDKLRKAVNSGLEVRGWDPINKEVIMKVEDVVTKEDLTDYATALLVSDDEIISIEVHDDDVRVVYEQPVKLFGLFSITMKQKVDISADQDTLGRVKVRFPWWSFLVKKTISSDDVRISVENALVINKVAQKVDSNNDSGTDNEMRYETRLLRTLSSIMKVSHDAAMNSIRNMK